MLTYPDILNNNNVFILEKIQKIMDSRLLLSPKERLRHDEYNRLDQFLPHYPVNEGAFSLSDETCKKIQERKIGTYDVAFIILYTNRLARQSGKDVVGTRKDVVDNFVDAYVGLNEADESARMQEALKLGIEKSVEDGFLERPKKIELIGINDEPKGIFSFTDL